jgi:large repetitive protein
VPTASKVGKSVLILGNGLIGTSSVKFNGVAATFTVESDTYIRATVPAGATTGKVSVVTASRTLNSNPRFVVTK